MAKVALGNHSAMRVPRAEKDRIRRFYRDVLGCELTRAGDQKDDFRMGGDFFIAVMYEDEGVLDEDGFLKSTYLELKTDNAEEMRRKIVDFGVKVLDVPDPHLYFQAPGGQVFRLVNVGEDLSKYEGTEHGEQFVGRAFDARSLLECLLSGEPAPILRAGPSAAPSGWRRPAGWSRR
jgi:catechol 2,3-dioxygenase-like lactoylglutathione lyase family enzyme